MNRTQRSAIPPALLVVATLLATPMISVGTAEADYNLSLETVGNIERTDPETEEDI